MNRALRACTYTAGAALALTLGACISPQVGAPCPIPDNATPAQRLAALQNCFGPIGEQYYLAGVQKDVDILFMIDNSSSMSPKQDVLAQNVNVFIDQIKKFGANYHVAVVTSDIGSTIAEGQSWSDSSISVCNSFKGDDGLLQVQSCSQRTNVTSDARNACPAVCANYGASVTTDGARYISSIDGKTNVPGDNVTDAFRCMALVGDGGCGIEGQLEAAKRALDGHRPENVGFRRSNAVLAVIFVTDEDDCSVQIARRNENSPSTRDCASPDQNASFDCFNYDYRCLARSVQCDQPMNTPGAKTNCHERADNYLEPVKKYYDFFTSMADPKKLVIGGIWTIPSLDKGAQLSINFQGAGSSTPFLNRAGGTQASCTASNVSIFGQAQRRLSSFANLFNPNDAFEATICDTVADNYRKNLQKIGDLIGKKLDTMCLPVVPKLLAPGQPNCLVGEVDESNKNALPDVLLPACSTTCCAGWANAAQPSNQDPGVIAACTAESKDCFCAVKSTQPDVCSDTAVGGVWRVGNVSPPSGRYVNFRCAGGG